MMLLTTGISFPNIGIEFGHVQTGIDVFGYFIAYYGMIIGLGMLLGLIVASIQAKRMGEDTEIYLDFALYAIVISVICARLYYVIFSWNEFKDNPIEILNIRSGGLAIYGGILGALATAIVYTKVKKYSFYKLADTGCLGLLVGQIIGRWGNFVNREAFGKYSDGLLAMRLNLQDVSNDYRCSVEALANKYAGRPKAYENIMEIRNHIETINGESFLQVHPTFLYESLWNLALFVLLFWYSKHKRFDGEIILLYLAGYGIGRMWIEGLRTDQLFMWGSPIAVSQALAGVMVVVSVILLITKFRESATKTKKIR